MAPWSSDAGNDAETEGVVARVQRTRNVGLDRLSEQPADLACRAARELTHCHRKFGIRYQFVTIRHNTMKFQSAKDQPQMQTKELCVSPSRR